MRFAPSGRFLASSAILSREMSHPNWKAPRAGRRKRELSGQALDQSLILPRTSRATRLKHEGRSAGRTGVPGWRSCARRSWSPRRLAGAGAADRFAARGDEPHALLGRGGPAGVALVQPVGIRVRLPGGEHAASTGAPGPGRRGRVAAIVALLSGIRPAAQTGLLAARHRRRPAPARPAHSVAESPTYTLGEGSSSSSRPRPAVSVFSAPVSGQVAAGVARSALRRSSRGSSEALRPQGAG
jgi:hypothetical protein